MPAYSFKGQFVSYVDEGSKPHTMRNRRKYFATIGDRICLYFGMRSQWCRKIGESFCTNTHSVAIDDFLGIIFYSRLLTDQEMDLAKVQPGHVTLPVSKILTPEERDSFAFTDGFRVPAFPSKESKQGYYNAMLVFWKSTHQLPWAGDIIYWSVPITKPATVK